MQILADQLNIPMDLIDVVTADTNAISMGIGTFASRITTNAGNSIYLAGQGVRTKIKNLAAFILKSTPDLIEMANGVAFVQDGTPEQRVSFKELNRPIAMAPLWLNLRWTKRLDKSKYSTTSWRMTVAT
jgi:carbon-monoxide dehydrogenase large subunit